MKDKNRRGAVLIMSMMAICLTFMMVYALIQTSGLGMRDSASLYDREAALMAAQSGLDYAVTRLQKNYGWRGDSNSAYWSDSDTDEKVYGSAEHILVGESNGNVVGLIRRSADSASVFRIKFNFEDNNSQNTFDKAVCNRFGRVNTNERLPKYAIQSPLVSVNNLQGLIAVPVYRAPDQGSSIGVGIAPKVDKLEFSNETLEEVVDDAIAFHLLPQRVYLAVEGFAGKGLRDCHDLDTANQIANSRNNVAARCIEACYKSNPPFLSGDAAFAEKEVKFTVKKRLYASTLVKKYTSDASVLDDPSTVPQPGCLSSKSDTIRVLDGKLNTYNGKLRHKGGIKAQFTPDDKEYTYINSQGEKEKFQFVKNEEVTAEGEAEKIAWDDVSKAEAVNANEIKAGFYQWQRTPDSTDADPRYCLLYYPNGYKLDDEDRPVPNNPSNFQIAVPGEVPQGTKVQYGGKTVEKISLGRAGNKIGFVSDDKGITEPTLVLQGNIYCSGNLTIGSDYSQAFAKCPRLQLSSYSGEDGQMEESVLTVAGNVYLASSLYGSGAVVTQNDVTFMGDSVLESGSCGVAVYANNVNLKSLDMAISQTPDGKPVDEVMSEEQIKQRYEGDPFNAAQFWLMLDTSWWNNIADTGYGIPREKEIKEYFANTYGVEVDAAVHSSCPEYGTKPPAGDRYYNVSVTFKDEAGVTIYTYHVKSRAHEIEVRENNCFGCVVSSPVIPSNAKKSASALPNSNEVPKKLQEQVDLFGDACYGDQSFDGIIYAKNKFKADLGEKFNLTVRGAIMVENGNIDVNCKNAFLTYDETYVRLLLPQYSTLHRTMWNCW